jgi:aminomethyltransferase
MTEENGTLAVRRETICPFSFFCGGRMETKLHSWHTAHGARMVDFGGWDMPVQYPTGPREEHVRVRTAAGLFDIDHMGRIDVTGPDALAFLQRVQTWDVSLLAAGRAHYSMLLNEKAGVIDDIFVYRLDAARWLLVVNAGNAAKDRAWLRGKARGFSVTLRDRDADTCMLALQGPAARAALQPLCRETDLGAVKFHRVVDVSIDGARSILCTTGYTGEPGYELVVPADRCARLWERILESGAAHRVTPCGLGARDTLRAEACLPLYGHELDEDTDPLSAGFARAAVKLEGHDFIGRKALAELALGAPRQVLVGFEMVETGVPRLGYPIARDGKTVGRVTTGLFSPSTGRYLGMGYVEQAFAAIGGELGIVIRDAIKAARVVERPFYTSPHWR